MFHILLIILYIRDLPQIMNVFTVGNEIFHIKIKGKVTEKSPQCQHTRLDVFHVVQLRSRKLITFNISSIQDIVVISFCLHTKLDGTLFTSEP